MYTRIQQPRIHVLCGFRSAFDRAKRNVILKMLEEEEDVDYRINKLIEKINKDNRIKIITSKGDTKLILVNTGIQQGNLLSPLLFNVIRDKIIDLTKVNIVCYTDDALLVAANEDDLQRQLHTFYIRAKAYNMKISAEKNKMHGD